MYTYNQIKKIKNNLYDLLNFLNKEDPDYKILSKQDSQNFKNSLSEYDTVLNQIGINGICKDTELNKGFKVTEEFLKKIKSTLN